jgi:type VI secretion system secreted protein Hcp
MPLLPVKAIESQSSGLELHLNLGSIQGESQSSLHKDEIEISSFSFGGTNVSIRSAQGSTKGGRPTVSEITVTKNFDKATTQLLSALVNSTVIKTASISMSKQTGAGKLEDYLVITLSNVIITSHQLSSSRSLPPGQLGSETVTLNYQKINIDYKIQLISGLLASGGTMAYDLAVGA